MPFFAVGAMNTKSDRRLGKYPIVVCECGQEILVIPDLQEMVRCIQVHATMHMQNEANLVKAEVEYDRIEELLTREVLKAIANKTNKDSKS